VCVEILDDERSKVGGAREIFADAAIVVIVIVYHGGDFSQKSKAIFF